MKKQLLFIGALALGLAAGAQQQRRCASFEHYQQQLARNPEMARNQEAIERFTQEAAGRPQPGGTQRGTPVYNIPVVVHVLWNTSTQNISDAQIQSQIDALNRDYQLNNPDTGLVPAAFKSFVADCKVSFCMAQRDPSGAATTGIIRKQTTKTSFSADTDDAKSNSTGGDNAWDRNSYLNLWVVPAITSGGQGGILGYAQFPGGAAATDGVVIGYNYFGTTGTAAAPFNKGRTATHEVGHWLNLRHIWGDESACAQDDLVSDTPLQGAENYGCPTFPHTDACSGGNGVMYMNYMDYVDDACMMMFTNGQKTRMYGVLQSGGARASLASSLGCQPPSTGSCGLPTGLTSSSVTSSSATVSWTAVSGAASYTVQYKTSSASTWTTAASATTATSVSLSGLTASTTYNWQVLTNCTSSSSAYVGASFTTTAVSSGCGTAYEPNESLSAAAAVSTNTALSAAITTTTDQDWFKVTLASASNFNISLTGLAGDYDLVLYNSAGTQIGISENGGTTSESITTTSSAAGTYYVKVFGYNGANSATCYSLNIGATASGSTCPGTYDNSTNGTTSGAAQIPFNTDIKGTIGSSTDVDYYKFVITTGGTITVTLGTLPADYDLKLYNSSGTQVGISQNGSTTSESISYTAAAGTYYAYVYGYNGATSATCYTLKVALGTASRQADPALTNAKVKVDVYPNPTSQTLNVSATGFEGRGQLRVIDANGRPVLQQGLLRSSAAIGVQSLARGVYYLQVIGSDGTVIGQSRFVKQ